MVDCFAGTGSLARASRSLNRHCISIEIDSRCFKTCLEKIQVVPSSLGSTIHRGRLSEEAEELMEANAHRTEASPTASCVHASQQYMGTPQNSNIIDSRISQPSSIARPLFPGPMPPPGGYLYPGPLVRPGGIRSIGPPPPPPPFYAPGVPPPRPYPGVLGQHPIPLIAGQGNYGQMSQGESSQFSHPQ